MAFMLAHNMSRDQLLNHEEELAPVPDGTRSAPSASDHTDGMYQDRKEKERHPRLEIVLDQDCLYLRGTGVDVEPARLSGHLVLYLTESTSVREITLHFRGKARLPIPSHESIGLQSSSLTYIICNHDWSFLEGEKKHSHTLKAGRHVFPFQLQIGGSLPSTIFTPVLGGASVIYKLRAHVVRSGFHNNLQAICPVIILRSFAPEALEYQQTLEIENTWPGKIMYSILVPHKAWAAGDNLTALVKFSPLTKGTSVVSITTSIHETTKIYARSGFQEHNRVVATMKHDIIGGKAVACVDNDTRSKQTSGRSTPHIAPTPPMASPAVSTANHTNAGGGYFSFSHGSTPPPPPPPPEQPVASSSTAPPPIHNPCDDEPSADVVTHLVLPIPRNLTPSHALEPIIVMHRIRWSILIHNADGHTSELRCSLPLHILAGRLLEEARSHTAATRRLLIGGPEVPPEEDEEAELPSYNAHVRDRVANMYLPEGATMRVTNPWVTTGVSPVVQADGMPVPAWPMSPSGASTPLEAHVLSHLPHQPGSGASTPLDWVNSELLLSLERDPPPLSQASLARTVTTPGTPPDAGGSAEASAAPSRGPSRPSSRPSSRAQSRAPSRLGSRFPSRHSSPEREPRKSTAHETYVHEGQASRASDGIFHATMKPFTSLPHPQWLSSRSSSSHNVPTLAELEGTAGSANGSAGNSPGARAYNVPLFQDPNSGSALLHRAFTEVPAYEVASRGFIGGVPPLTSMRGLPSYDDAQRTRSSSDASQRFAGDSQQRSISEGDLAGRFRQAMGLSYMSPPPQLRPAGASTTALNATAPASPAART
ncbi:uncharacterized protein SCHCODRAFT_02364181 [Schizophyllum commune H4-8]|uniref:uncharacterized protein n=1 Tax=Schizophyllum commune (strain H4-8 / FGSC 9210) TaxID=578458 RepID=UPI00215ED3AA|nr:uncharacterized protein SCHCODRAFT_02364181 [Schizophyllum commune H4-8]KAI5889271.1 hypothetical protein SCHCODRAFT_02364181 [Schizophyllum commune H4-8]